MLTCPYSSVKPVNYDISLHDLELGGSYSYHGTVKIDLEVRKNTTEIVLNTLQLKIGRAEVRLEGSKCKSQV